MRWRSVELRPRQRTRSASAEEWKRFARNAALPACGQYTESRRHRRYVPRSEQDRKGIRRPHTAQLGHPRPLPGPNSTAQCALRRRHTEADTGECRTPRRHRAPRGENRWRRSIFLVWGTSGSPVRIANPLATYTVCANHRRRLATAATPHGFAKQVAAVPTSSRRPIFRSANSSSHLVRRPPPPPSPLSRIPVRMRASCCGAHAALLLTPDRASRPARAAAMNRVRKLVSKKKTRYIDKDSGFNLDLTYIGDRIVSMVRWCARVPGRPAAARRGRWPDVCCAAFPRRASPPKASRASTGIR